MGFAFHRIEKALSLLVANLSDLSGLAAKTERIDALFAGASSCTCRKRCRQRFCKLFRPLCTTGLHGPPHWSLSEVLYPLASRGRNVQSGSVQVSMSKQAAHRNDTF